MGFDYRLSAKCGLTLLFLWTVLCSKRFLLQTFVILLSQEDEIDSFLFITTIMIFIALNDLFLMGSFFFPKHRMLPCCLLW